MWSEFTINIYDHEDINTESWMSKGMINISTIIRFYATFDDKDRKCVMLKFIDGEDLCVYEAYKEVKDKMKPIIETSCK